MSQIPEFLIEARLSYASKQFTATELAKKLKLSPRKVAAVLRRRADPETLAEAKRYHRAWKKLMGKRLEAAAAIRQSLAGRAKSRGGAR